MPRVPLSGVGAVRAEARRAGGDVEGLLWGCSPSSSLWGGGGVAAPRLASPPAQLLPQGRVALGASARAERGRWCRRHSPQLPLVEEVGLRSPVGDFEGDFQPGASFY